MIVIQAIVTATADKTMQKNKNEKYKNTHKSDDHDKHIHDNNKNNNNYKNNDEDCENDNDNDKNNYENNDAEVSIVTSLNFTNAIHTSAISKLQSLLFA